MSELRKRKLASVTAVDCVACGCCVKACRLGAIDVFYGMYATVDEKKCVGCGGCKTACPAGAIAMVEAAK